MTQAAPLSRFRAFLMTPGILRSGGLAFLLGSVSVMAHAPFGLWPMMIFTLTALVWLLDGAFESERKYRSAAWRAWAFAFGYFFFGLYWVAYAFINRGPEFAPMIPFAITLLPAGLALFWALAGALAMRFWTRDVRRILVFGLAIFAAEYARGHLFSGFPWNLPGLIWPAGGPVSQSAAWFGVYGLSFLTLTGFAAPAAMAGPDASPRLRSAPLAVSFAVFAILFGMGLGRLARPVSDDAQTVTVRVVEAGFGQRDKWDPAGRQAVIDRYAALSGAGDLDSVDMVIWPEAALPLPLLEDGAALAQLGGALGGETWLGTGLYRRSPTPDGGTEYYNSFAVLGFSGDQAQLAALYDKRLLVPFGEFTPGAAVLNRLGFRLPSAIASGMTPGPGPVTLDVAGVPPFAPLICYEIIFPGFTPDGENRPSWILNVSNDAWFGPTPGPWQHLAQARFRAIEEGLPVIRAASGGVSGAIDARGRQVAAMPPYSSDYLDIQIPDPGYATLYSRFGFLGVLALVLVALGALALLARSGLTPAKTRVDNKKTSY
ncbi:apolipoprotein N-acyltransferase [Euryhalocaulis caribicus]|uniref:apolipoprotein N-acyltransferase n=1 Tax=Euryhalocaulis caribicus TaxID=1161401 RepID=UPI0003A80A94|nr:apolipoprotein N-acyltransferase [Euryhalocaulis caribicus]